MENPLLKVLPWGLLVAPESKVAADTESELEQEYASRCEVCRNRVKRKPTERSVPLAGGSGKNLIPQGYPEL